MTEVPLLISKLQFHSSRDTLNFKVVSALAPLRKLICSLVVFVSNPTCQRSQEIVIILSIYEISRPRATTNINKKDLPKNL